MHRIKRWRRAIIALDGLRVTLVHRHPLEVGMGVDSRRLDLTQSSTWDALREGNDYFRIPADREAWRRLCESSAEHESLSDDLGERAQTISTLMARWRIGQTVYSIGVGLAALEFRLLQANPGMRLFCLDYSPHTVSRLASVFPEAAGHAVLDIGSTTASDALSRFEPDSLVLLHRVDPHLDDAEWEKAFERMRGCGISYILYVPHFCIDLPYALRCLYRGWRSWFPGSKLVRTGYVRSESQHRHLFSKSYEVVDTPSIGYSRGFLLKAMQPSSIS